MKKMLLIFIFIKNLLAVTVSPLINSGLLAASVHHSHSSDIAKIVAMVGYIAIIIIILFYFFIMFRR
jgi:hypothetical protein